MSEKNKIYPFGNQFESYLEYQISCPVCGSPQNGKFCTEYGTKKPL